LPPIKVGRYINRNDNSATGDPGYAQWWQNSWDFMGGLAAADQPGLFDASIADFIDSQYLWAYPEEFTSNKEAYVDSVHIADTEVHGNWHEIWTLYDWGDTVDLETDVPASGYGPGAGGSLAYWILHSCEVIPTPIDYAAPNANDAWNVWFNIFNGMHAAVGYRTEMYINDGVMFNFGKMISFGGAVVPAWLGVVIDDSSAYGTTHYDNKNPRGINEPIGRPAAVAVCGHEDDIVTDIENLGRPGCLQMWWYDN
jgi:Family of unknown function (DUF6345)